MPTECVKEKAKLELYICVKNGYMTFKIHSKNYCHNWGCCLVPEVLLWARFPVLFGEGVNGAGEDWEEKNFGMNTVGFLVLDLCFLLPKVQNHKVLSNLKHLFFPSSAVS